MYLITNQTVSILHNIHTDEINNNSIYINYIMKKNHYNLYNFFNSNFQINTHFNFNNNVELIYLNIISLNHLIVLQNIVNLNNLLLPNFVIANKYKYYLLKHNHFHKLYIYWYSNIIYSLLDNQ